MVKLWYYGKNYGTMEKTMVLYRKLWNFDLLWKKLWYYGKNYGIIVNYSKLQLTIVNYSLLQYFFVRDGPDMYE